MIEFNAAWTPYLSAFSSPMIVVVKEAASATPLTTYLSALSTPVLAIVAAGIAYRQWRTAQNKLKLDLLERRLAVYEAVTALFAIPIVGTPLSREQFYDYKSKLKPAEFLFDENIATYVEYLEDAAFCLIDGAQAEEQRRWLLRNRHEVIEAFKPFLRLSH